MRFFLYIVVIIFTSSCNQNIFNGLSTDEKLANKILRKAAFQIQEKTGMFPSGDGARMMDEIKMLALSFRYYQEVSIEQGRELLVTSVEEFLSIINADDKIRPYLNNYPFEPQNIEIAIIFYNPNGSDIKLGELSVLSIIEGTLEYDVNDPKTTFLKTIYKESYEEALQKINDNSNKAA